MKIGLINPINSPTINLGLAYILTTLEKSRHRATLIDLAFRKNPLQYALYRVAKERPDVIGLSTLSQTYPVCESIAQEIKQRYPYIKLIWGGVHPTLLADEMLQKPIVDAVCLGEGEYRLIKYLDMLEEGKERNIEGVWYKGDGYVIKTPPQGFILDLDSLPYPNFDYWDLSQYFAHSYLPGALPVLATRGCVYNCSFCSNKPLEDKIGGSSYRLRDPEKVVQEIEINFRKYKSVGFKTVFFYDEIFGYNKLWFKEFIRRYKERGLHRALPWKCETCAHIVSQTWAEEAKESGCIFVGLGLETANEKRRVGFYNKTITNSQFISVASLFKKIGMHFSINIIIGCPEETVADIKKTYRFAKSLNPDLLVICVYLPLPKTKLAEICLSKNYLKNKEKYFGLPRVETPFLSIRQLRILETKLKFKAMATVILSKIGILNFLFHFYEFFSGFLCFSIKNHFYHTVTKILFKSYLSCWKREKI